MKESTKYKILAYGGAAASVASAVALSIITRGAYKPNKAAQASSAMKFEERKRMARSYEALEAEAESRAPRAKPAITAGTSSYSKTTQARSVSTSSRKTNSVVSESVGPKWRSISPDDISDIIRKAFMIDLTFDRAAGTAVNSSKLIPASDFSMFGRKYHGTAALEKEKIACDLSSVDAFKDSYGCNVLRITGADKDLLYLMHDDNHTVSALYFRFTSDCAAFDVAMKGICLVSCDASVLRVLRNNGFPVSSVRQKR